MRVMKITSLCIAVVVFITTPVFAESLEGTWVSQSWSHQSHTFAGDGSVVFDEGQKRNSGSRGGYNRTGDEIEWQIKWKSGSFTNWAGVIDDASSMRVRYYNDWDKSTGNDTLVRQ